MNHYYRLVRSADGTRYMPAPETAKSQGKASKAVASVSRDDTGRGRLKLKNRPEMLTVSQPFMSLFRNM